MVKIASSILTADFSHLAYEIKRLEEAEIDLIHIDVMDGIFVPNITIGPNIIKSLREKTNIIFDIHLMIHEPIRYLKVFKKAGANILTVHKEACKDIIKTIEEIKKTKCKIGLAINPSTSLNSIKHILAKIDILLLMSVNPGFGGQKFLKKSLAKIEAAKRMIKKLNKKLNIEVDGGICLKNAKEVVERGADILVIGSALFSKKDFKKEIIKIKEKLYV